MLSRSTRSDMQLFNKALRRLDRRGVIGKWHLVESMSSLYPKETHTLHNYLYGIYEKAPRKIPSTAGNSQKIQPLSSTPQPIYLTTNHTTTPPALLISQAPPSPLNSNHKVYLQTGTTPPNPTQTPLSQSTQAPCPA